MGSPLVIPDVPSLPDFEGRDLGATDWHTIDQKRIDAFAEATGDDQWIHVDPGGLGENCSQIVNYGIEKLRLREPIPSESRIRLGATIKSIRSVPGGAMRTVLATRFEVEGARRPACTGDLIFVYFP